MRSMSKVIFGYCLRVCDCLGLLDDWWLRLLPDYDAFGFFMILVLESSSDNALEQLFRLLELKLSECCV